PRQLDSRCPTSSAMSRAPLAQEARGILRRLRSLRNAGRFNRHVRITRDLEHSGSGKARRLDVPAERDDAKAEAQAGCPSLELSYLETGARLSADEESAAIALGCQEDVETPGADHRGKTRIQ